MTRGGHRRFRLLGRRNSGPSAGPAAYSGLSPSASNCRLHSVGGSRSRSTPMPRGRRPSIAALTRLGARKASEMVMLTLAPIVIAGPDQRPAGMGLALDVCRGCIVLRVERVELLIEPMLGRNTGIDRAADGFDRRSLHGRTPTVDRSSLSRRPKKRGPFHLVPVMAKATLERLS